MGDEEDSEVGNEGDRWDKICMIKENPEGEECGK